ncbi:flavin-containing monooxygenase [Deinococcus yavapaiensis]|uniref:Cation diffusion facilitator CzcD-associated flavoprotein CzcO n=1 Tax=Deinococcus yavapaiensis KR-236 TaxID=694435 RepID=A0A318S5X1_9DEIO|nr:NAD(P)/FAD-dependent oxidoreductase [Deinococcus yavapaiensis]PYE53542.1 cation diffusion facilitator CzcD-associated flavoprotein CzcO [Deinococcus yavapaiensis KR-236]
MTSSTEATASHVHVAVIGSGFAGIAMAIRLLGDGERDFVVFERASDVGGTWRDNTYPGCACDVPSNLYSFSFAPYPDWSRRYAPQTEILAYLRDVARRFGVLPHVRFSHEVRTATWDDAEGIWRLETSGGPWTATFVVSGQGPLSTPKWPDLPGLHDFGGELMHSARWNHAYDLAGKRVAVIGTGASAIQFVPAIQPRVAHLTVFQRSAPWIVPRGDRAFTSNERRAFRSLPITQRLSRAAIFLKHERDGLGFWEPRLEPYVRSIAARHLKAQVRDASLRAKLTPNYRIGCKRILVSDDYYPALQQPNVSLVTEPIERVTKGGVVTANGTLHEVDAMLCGTGFEVATMPFARLFRGKDGRTLAQTWASGPEAYLGTTVANFPNLFLLLGPNVLLGHNSVLYMMEAQVAYVAACLQHARREHLQAFDVRPEAQRTYNDALQARFERSAWSARHCASWYLDEHGRNVTLWPDFALSFRRRLRAFDPAAYQWRLRVRPYAPREARRSSKT